MHITNKQMDGTILKGELLLPGRAHPLQVSLELDEETATEGDYEALLQQVEAFIPELSPLEEASVKEQVTKEITDAAYSQMDHKPTEEDYNKLFLDLTQQEIAFYTEDMVWWYSSPTIFPNNKITVQLGYDFEIIDMSVAE